MANSCIFPPVRKFGTSLHVKIQRKFLPVVFEQEIIDALIIMRALSEIVAADLMLIEKFNIFFSRIPVPFCAVKQHEP
jgi:hypothetical protein